jgi:hypothetical protein
MSFVLDSASTVARTLANGDFGFIAATGRLQTTGVAIDATGSVMVGVEGTLVGDDNAITASGTLQLVVGIDGRIDSNHLDTIAVSGGGNFVNHGRIDSGEDALDIRGSDVISITNDGVLSGDSDGVVTDSASAKTTIVNTGTIQGVDGGIDHLSGDALVINRGTISGQDFYGYDGANDRDVLRNFGTIEGGVFTQTKADLVVNRGEIDFVQLQAGDDEYVGQGTGSADKVSGGGGEDTLTGSRADDNFSGGLEGDTFVFAKNGGDDTIRDFGGLDVIDLSALGLSSFGDVRDATSNVANGCLIDLSDDGLSLLLLGVAKGDLSGGDFIL